MLEIVQEKLDASEKKMNKAVEHLKQEFSTIHAGRANPAVLDKIQVDYYGVPTPIKSLANVSVSEGRILQIQPFDTTAIRQISKAILGSDLGITPTDDGKIIRLVFPQPTGEERKKLAKNAKKYSEDAKVIIRNERRDLIEKIKKLKKDSQITEDDLAQAEKKAQKLTDKLIESVEQIYAAKEKDITSI